MLGNAAKRTFLMFLAITVGFLVLYAATAQRGLGWGDSGEFQFRILEGGVGTLADCDSFATAHPLYVALAKAFCHTPFHVTFISCVFGALAVGGFFLCSRNLALTVLWGLSHAVWWLSCVAEVYTMSLAFLAFETFCLLRYLEYRRMLWLIALFALNGLHLELHNLALLALPVYAFVWFRDVRRNGPMRSALPPLAWLFGASFWLESLVVRGAADVLYGSYGGQTLGLLPKNWTIAAFNLALTAMSLVVPFLIWWWHRRSGCGWKLPVGGVIVALFGVNFLFFVRYFIISQFTFALPTLFFAYLAVSRLELRANRAISLALMQMLLPVLAWQVLEQLPRPRFYARHKYRNDAKYFALPWKFADDSADRYAAELGGKWNGYPDCGRENKAK